MRNAHPRAAAGWPRRDVGRLTAAVLLVLAAGMFVAGSPLMIPLAWAGIALTAVAEVM